MTRQPVPAAQPPRGELLLGSIADLVHGGSSEALLETLAELDRAIRLEAEQLRRDPGAAKRLSRLQNRMTEVATRLEAEQRRVGLEVIAVQAEIQARARYVPAPSTAVVLDRRG